MATLARIATDGTVLRHYPALAEAAGHAADGAEGEKATVLTKPAQVDPGNPTADVRLGFAQPTDLPAGAAVSVAIVAEERPHALTVAAAGVVHDGNETFVMVAGADNKAHKRAVKTGLA